MTLDTPCVGAAPTSMFADTDTISVLLLRTPNTEHGSVRKVETWRKGESVTDSEAARVARARMHAEQSHMTGSRQP